MDGEPQGAIRERGKKLEARMKGGGREGDEARRRTKAQNSTHPLHLVLTWEHSGQCVNTNLSMCCIQWSLSREA